jgi:L-aminopeptidase/D-esterase-like protein
MTQWTDSITDVPGIKVGHAQNEKALTGCTVVLVESGAAGGVDQRGGAPGTRETDAMRPMHVVDKIHAIVLSGGSAFGLDAAGGVMRYLSEKGIGFDTGVAKVPIVGGAVIFDLAIGDPSVHPDAEMGYQACLSASAGEVPQGNIGVGMGATVGKMLGMTQSMKSGVGSASEDLGGGLIVGAIVAVNAFGDVVDPGTSRIIAGTRTLHKGPIAIGKGEIFADTLNLMKTMTGKTIMSVAGGSNTVIGVIATNARLNREQTNKVAQMAQDGLARSIRPAHTMMDGDTIFALATGKKPADVNIIGAYAAEVFARAIEKAVRFASPVNDIPSISSLQDRNSAARD